MSQCTETGVCCDGRLLQFVVRGGTGYVLESHPSGHVTSMTSNRRQAKLFSLVDGEKVMEKIRACGFHAVLEVAL